MIELASLLVLGLLAQWLAWRIKVPAILPLIIVGLSVGPLSSLVMPGGHKFIDGDAIFQGDFLFDVIGLSVGLILFEGGLTLKFSEIRNLGATVRKLIIFGTVITLFGGAAAVHFIMDMNVQTAFLFGALVIVTGPTVIGPILRNVRPSFNINTLLKWEGILIDPVGALVAVLIYEFIISGQSGDEFALFSLKTFGITILTGTVVGFVFAWIIRRILNKKLVPDYLRNIVVLALIVMSFALSDVIHAESGLLAVTLTGMVLANLKVEGLKKVVHFKEEVVLILISFLFVMLSSRIDIVDIQMVMTWQSLAVFCIIVYILRPIAVFLSTYRSELSLREKIFVSFICPRGIVAAGVASVFSLKLAELPAIQASLSASFDVKLLLPLTFLIIVGTVVIQGLTAKPLAKFLNVLGEEPRGVLFLGASEPAVFLANQLKSYGIPVLLADTSAANLREASKFDLPVFEGSLLKDDAREEADLTDYGQLYAMTSNPEINLLSCKMFASEFGDKNVFRLMSRGESEQKKDLHPENVLFNGFSDFIGMSRQIRENSFIKEAEIDSTDDYLAFLQKMENRIIPLFVLTAEARALPAVQTMPEIGPDSLLVYLVRSAA